MHLEQLLECVTELIYQEQLLIELTRIISQFFIKNIKNNLHT